MTSHDPWQAPDAAPSSGIAADNNAAPWTASSGVRPDSPPPMQYPYQAPWPGAFAPPATQPRSAMSRRTRVLLISVGVFVGVLLIAGVSTLAVLVARDAANDSEAAASEANSSELVTALDTLDEDTSWTVAETLAGGNADAEWAARLYSSSSGTTRTKDVLTSLLQEDGYESISVTEHLEPRTVDYVYEVSGFKGDVYATAFVGGEMLYEYEDDGTAVSVEAPAGGSAINIRLSSSSYASD